LVYGGKEAVVQRWVAQLVEQGVDAGSIDGLV
jgi:hypothetical protein